MDDMGTFHVTIEVAASAEGPFEPVEALVEVRSSYAVLSRPLLERLSVIARETRTFIVPDGSKQEREVGTVWLRLDADVRPSVVVFGDIDASPLLGLVTLSELGVEIDPAGQRLVPATAYLPGLIEVRSR